MFMSYSEECARYRHEQGEESLDAIWGMLEDTNDMEERARLLGRVRDLTADSEYQEYLRVFPLPEEDEEDE